MTAEQLPLWRRILAGTAAYSAAILIGRMAAVLLLPVYTRYLTPSDYGVLEIIDLTMYLLGAVVGVGIAGDALFYFHARLEGARQKLSAVQSILLAALAISLAGSAMVLLLAPWISQWFFKSATYAPGLRIAAVSFVCGPPVDALLCYLRAVEKTRAFLVFSIVRLVLSIALNVILLTVFHLGLYAILVSNMTASILILASLSIYSARLMGAWAGADLQLLRQVARYSMPIGVASTSMLIVHYGDRFFLSRYCTLADIGIYALAYKLGMAMGYLNAPFQMFWRSQVYSIVDNKDGDQIFIRVFCYLEILLVTFALGLALFAVPIVHLLAAKDFWRSAIFVPWLVAAYTFSALDVQMQSVLLVSAKTKKIMLSTVSGVLVCLAIYATAIPKYGVWGAVGATLLAFGTMFAITLAAGVNQRKLDMPWVKVAYLPLAAVALAVVRSRVEPAGGLLGLAISTAFLAALPASMLLLPFYRDERQLARKLAGKLISRFAPA